MARKGESLKSPIVVTYRSTERSRTKKVKVLRGKTDDNLERILTCTLPGFTDKTAIDHIGIGYRYVPEDKLTAGDRQAIKSIQQETLKMLSK